MRLGCFKTDENRSLTKREIERLSLISSEPMGSINLDRVVHMDLSCILRLSLTRHHGMVTSAMVVQWSCPFWSSNSWTKRMLLPIQLSSDIYTTLLQDSSLNCSYAGQTEKNPCIFRLRSSHSQVDLFLPTNSRSTPDNCKACSLSTQGRWLP